ncbi:transposase [Propionivibrio sp.]|uniref:transposase n=1 Tax=Propionivibrio sp. TaxID=2212460 RepID=UPI003BF20FC9
MSKKKSPQKTWPPRFPPEAAGIQVNHCKNPTCANFGVPPKEKPANPRGRRPSGTALVPPGIGDYIVCTNQVGDIYLPALRCCLCGETIPMQSNLAIAEELLRISAYLEPPVGPTCPNEDCEFHNRPVTEVAGNYVRYGANRHGTPRYRCNHCGKVFSVAAKATHRQKVTHPNRDIFEHLMNTVPIRRIIKLLKITPGILYRRIDFIWNQCRLFAGARERSLLEREDLGKRYLCADRQALMVNWASSKDRRNTLLWSTATADLETGYVFAATLNFDPEIDADAVAHDLTRYGDHKHAQPFRRYARVWLPQDYDAAARSSALRTQKRTKGEKLDAAIEAAYEAAMERADIEAGDGPAPTTRTPVRGMQVREQVSMNAHVQFVARLLHKAEKVRLYMDQESGIRAAFMAAYQSRIPRRTADAWYVQVLKEGTQGQKQKLLQAAQRRFAQTQLANGHLSESQVAEKLMRDEMAAVTAHGRWKDGWVRHPMPDMREPVKGMCWLTDIDVMPPVLAEDDEASATAKREQIDDQLTHAARLYLKGALHAVDKFFMQVRRGLTMAERGVVVGARNGLWFGKNAYDPGNLARLLEMFRVYYNYCEVGEDKQTPAMRLGLAKGPVASEDIIYFMP